MTQIAAPRRLRPAASGVPVVVLERASFFHGVLQLGGHAFWPDSAIVSMVLILGDGREMPLPRPGAPSADWARRHGPAAAACGFAARLTLGEDVGAVLGARLVLCCADGRRHAAPIAISDPADSVLALVERFFAMLAARPPGHLLEIGSRDRTGGMSRNRLPDTWRYTGFDVMDGPNVDIVGDAHAASRFLPHEGFDAAMSFAVFEHLLMPWKAAIELNRVLKPGAIALIAAPQCWPLHEEPCDYFRFSAHAWKALFNRATGFEILAVEQAPRAFIVPLVHNAGTAFGEAHTGALMSAVLFRKTAATTLDWPVDMGDIADDLYPA